MILHSPGAQACWVRSNRNGCRFAFINTLRDDSPPCNSPPAISILSTPSCDVPAVHGSPAHACPRPWCLGLFFFSHCTIIQYSERAAPAVHEVLDSPLMLQQDGHDDCLKRPWAGDHDPSLDVQLGAIEEPVEERLIGFRKGFFERHPAAAFCFNALAERRQGFCPWHDPLTMGALKCLRKFHWS
jgi:hypothetical protein